MKNRNLLFLRQPDFYVLILAFLVASAICTISFITNRSIEFLQFSNRNTNKSFELKDKVQALLSDVLLMETTQRGIVLSNDNDSAPYLKSRNKVQEDLKQLQPLVDAQSGKEYDQLSFFVSRKIKFTNLVFAAFHQKGKAEAEGIIMTKSGDQLRDSIYRYAGKLESGFS